jgi:proline iminopeptidase
VLAGHSYGGFLALDYAVNHSEQLLGFIAIDTWTNGVYGSQNVLANILTSDRVSVDKTRQVRVWSGNLKSNQDYQDAIAELLPFYSPPDYAVEAPTTEASNATTSAGFFSTFHFETQNFAFGYNMPRFDVRGKLGIIKVSLDVPFTTTSARNPL